MRRQYLAVALCVFLESAHAGETLYNGIALPDEWPPRLTAFATSAEKAPVTPPYLTSPPAVIPIDVGRQLFVDDFLIAQTTLTRTFHLPKYHPASPVLKPDQPWEMKNPDHAAAMVFSDGVWYDPRDKLFKMWYLGGESASTGYATSTDGIHWNKPSLDVRPPTNIVQPGGRDSSTVWLDLEEKDPARRFKMFRVIGGGGEDPVTGWNNWVMAIHFSADGIHWGEPVAKTGRVVDRSTVFWNPFRKVWVYSIRHAYKVGDAVDKSYGFARRRSYVEGPELLAAAHWEVNEPLRWTDVDRLDPQREDLKIKPQLYNLDAVAYESLMVGFFTIWRGQPADRHKPNNVILGYSRDGWHWSRPDRRAFCDVSDKQVDWNANNVQSAGGGFLVVGDELYFYVSGRSGRPGNNKAGTCTTGLATLRRDGFASMDAGESAGTLTTRPVRFTGKHLFVNVDDPNGELRVEILNEAGEALPRFTCIPVVGNRTLHLVGWKDIDDLSSLANEPVRFRFHLKNGKLYAFWVSPDNSGASQGYVAAGGPGFSSNRDTGSSPVWTDKSPHETGFITVNGVRLHYLDWGGKGETMLFLHGAGDTPHSFDNLAPKFTNGFHVLALTRRGHGESEIPETGYDTATRVEDIRQLLDALKIRRAILVGHSAAGNELSLFAITHPDRTIKLVYLDAAFYMDGQLELFKRIPAELLPTKADNESLDSWRRWYQGMNQGWSDALEATLRVKATVANAEKRNRALALMMETEARPDHKKIKVPALMISVINPGAHALKHLAALPEQRRKTIEDFLSEARKMKEQEVEFFRKAIPNGQVVIFTNADHHCFIDREADVVREMRTFLSETQRSP